MNEETKSTRLESLNRSKRMIGPRQREILEVLEGASRGMTAWEIKAKIGRMIHVIRPRLTELSRMERPLITSIGTRLHKPTNRDEAVWIVLGPMDVTKRELFGPVWKSQAATVLAVTTDIKHMQHTVTISWRGGQMPPDMGRKVRLRWKRKP